MKSNSASAVLVAGVILACLALSASACDTPPRKSGASTTSVKPGVKPAKPIKPSVKRARTVKPGVRPPRATQLPPRDPLLRGMWEERREIEQFKGNPQVVELMESLQKLRDASTPDVDLATFEQLYGDAKFAMDVFDLHNAPRGIAAQLFAAYAKTATMEYGFWKAAVQTKRDGFEKVPEAEIHDLLLLKPDLRKRGQRAPDGGLEFPIDEVISALKRYADGSLSEAEFKLKY